MNTKQGNEFQKLHELDEIPDGFHFDKDAVWQRLEARLKSQPAEKRDKTYILLLVAFTCLIVFSLEFLTFYYLESNVEVKHEQIGEAFQQTRSDQIVIRKSGKITVKKYFIAQKEIVKERNQEMLDTLTFVTSNSPDTASEPAVSGNVNAEKSFPITYYNELPEQQGPIIIPGQGRTKIANLFKKKSPVMVYENGETINDINATRKKSKGSFN